MLIDGGARSVVGTNQTSTAFFRNLQYDRIGWHSIYVNVELGQLRTDTQGRLIVLGGNGISGEPSGVSIRPDFYRNPGRRKPEPR